MRCNGAEDMIADDWLCIWLSEGRVSGIDSLVSPLRDSGTVFHDAKIRILHFQNANQHLLLTPSQVRLSPGVARCAGRMGR